jgi:hypothetical protein
MRGYRQDILEVSHTILSQELDKAIVELSGMLRELAEAHRGGDWRVFTVRGTKHIGSATLRLRNLADRLLDAGSPLRPWYDLGAAIGDARRPPRGETGLRTVEDVDAAVGHVVSRAVAVPAHESSQVPALRWILEHAPATGGREALGFVCQLARAHFGPHRSLDDAAALAWFSDIFRRLTDKIGRELSGLTPASSPPRGTEPAGTEDRKGGAAEPGATPASVGDLHIPWDNATEERNKYIYEEMEKGTKYSSIRRNLVEMCKSKRLIKLNSNKGLKYAADRYAELHGLQRIRRYSQKAHRRPG